MMMPMTDILIMISAPSLLHCNDVAAAVNEKKLAFIAILQFLLLRTFSFYSKRTFFPPFTLPQRALNDLHWTKTL
jgi:hypothetical protein